MILINVSSTDVDVKILAMHAFAFGLYMVSIIVGFVFLAYYYISESNKIIIKPKAALYTDMFCVCSSFVAQVFLCAIIWTLSEKQSKELFKQ
jgi:hypothetical protein